MLLVVARGFGDPVEFSWCSTSGMGVMGYELYTASLLGFHGDVTVFY
jgi:hypothetical protein